MYAARFLSTWYVYSLFFVTFIPTRLTENCRPADNTCRGFEEAVVEKMAATAVRVMSTDAQYAPRGRSFALQMGTKVDQ